MPFNPIMPGIRFFVLVAICMIMHVAGGELIWIEGESAVNNTMKPNPWYSDAVKKDELSGGSWLSNFAPGIPPEASYQFDVAAAGEYHFWARMNPVANPSASYDLNGTGWKDIDFSKHKDNRNISVNAAPDMRFTAWIDIGTVTLKRGANIIKIRFTSKAQNHGSLDCMLFTQDVFIPDGKRKPGEKLGLAENGMWAFEPDRDPLSKDALLDLSALNEPITKTTPFVKVDESGDFVQAGKPIRFWAINSYTQKGATLEELKRHGRWLAKRGVNLVRWHGHLPTDQEGADTKLTDVNKPELDECFKLVAAMKESGIYTCISPYWGPITKNKASWGLSHINNDNLAAVVFWDPKVQSAYKEYLRVLYTTPNPYSGIALKDDPAVAIIQLQNEDSMLFWTFQNVKGKVLDDLKSRFMDFVQKRYGSYEKASQAWGGGKLGDDEPQAGRLGFVNLWELSQIRGESQEKRKSDQFEFLCYVMRDFNEKMERYLRDELGCHQIVNAGNWRTACDKKMLDGERYSYGGNGVIGANRYKSTVHIGPRAGYLIAPGDTYSNMSVLRNPAELPVALKQVAGKAMIVPESNWIPPEKYQAEGPLLVAAYSALTGVDCLIWFCHGKTEWEQPFGKWSIGTPMQMGQFPAAAMMFRNGYLKRGQPAVVEQRPLEDLWQRKDALITEGQAFDPNRDTKAVAVNDIAREKSEISPLAFLVGPVEVAYGEKNASTHVEDMTKFIDYDEKSATSNTGQLKLAYGTGLFTVNAPRAQCAAGWLSQRKEIALTDVTIMCRNEYAAISVVSMDNQPLSTAKKILIQIGTFNRPYGYKEEKTTITQKGLPPVEGFKILDLGQAIWNIERVNAELLLKNAAIRNAFVLDANGMKVRSVPMSQENGKVKIVLPEDALYVVLQQ